MNDKEITNDILLADIMLRLAALERLLLEKQVFSKEDLIKITEEIAKQAAKIVMEKAKNSKTIEELITNLEEDNKKELKN